MNDASDKVALPSREQLQNLPPHFHRVIVFCREFRCLGYMDEAGVWRDDSKSRELVDVMGWEEI